MTQGRCRPTRLSRGLTLGGVESRTRPLRRPADGKLVPYPWSDVITDLVGRDHEGWVSRTSDWEWTVSPSKTGQGDAARPNRGWRSRAASGRSRSRRHRLSLPGVTQVRSETEVRLLRLRSQQLIGSPGRQVREVVGAALGMQAQAVAPSRLAVRVRSSGLTAEDVARACNVERSVVRTWLFRGTLQMVAREDAGWLVRLLGPHNLAGDERRRRQLGLTPDLVDRGLRAIRTVLADRGRLTRSELVARIAELGAVLDPRSQGPAHLLFAAAAHGLVCRGPDLAKDEPTYVLLDDWVGEQPPLDGDAALAMLARRYLAAHQPAGHPDLAAWAGIPARQAARAFDLVSAELTQMDVAGEPAWMLAGSELEPDRGSEPRVRLLGHWDGYLMGYRKRGFAVAPEHWRRIWTGGGFIRPVVLFDGCAVATWRQERRSRHTTVVVEPFEGRLDAETLSGVDAEVRDLGRFLTAEVFLAAG